MPELDKTFEILNNIYNKHRKKYPKNSIDSKQMCLMWSTHNPPDQIEGTQPFIDIEEAFNIIINDEDALELYDMSLKQATVRILAMQEAN